MKVPGSALAFEKKGSRQATELDFIAEVRDSRNRPAATVRDTIPLKVDQDIAGKVLQKSIQYDTGVTLSPGAYTLRFVARENGQGKTGTFETRFTIPDLAATKSLRVSSLVVSNQRAAVSDQIGGVKNAKKLVSENPLIDNGQKLVPNVTKVFRPGQNLLVYLEVYDPAAPENVPSNFQLTDVETTLAFFRDNRKVFETEPVRSGRVIGGRSAVVPVRLTVPLGKIEPGKYECQLNVIDELGRRFAFPRTALAVLADAGTPQKAR